MRRKDLEILLQQVNAFDNPKVELEQYPTSPQLAAEVLLLIQQQYGDVEGKNICDLGCGTGRLALGCAALGANKVVGVDCDPEALEIAVENCSELFDDEDEDVVVKFLEADIVMLCPENELDQESESYRELRALAIAGDERKEDEALFDVVLTNPPFGTRNSGVDMKFVQVGLLVRFFPCSILV
jgi:predicted RNA methylase